MKNKSRAEKVNETLKGEQRQVSLTSFRIAFRKIEAHGAYGIQRYQSKETEGSIFCGAR
jgi:hypothetical protein